MSASESSANLERCLGALASKRSTNEERLVALCVLPRLLDPADEAQCSEVLRKMHWGFLLRLIPAAPAARPDKGGRGALDADTDPLYAATLASDAERSAERGEAAVMAVEVLSALMSTVRSGEAGAALLVEQPELVRCVDRAAGLLSLEDPTTATLSLLQLFAQLAALSPEMRDAMRARTAIPRRLATLEGLRPPYSGELKRAVLLLQLELCTIAEWAPHISYEPVLDACLRDLNASCQLSPTLDGETTAALCEAAVPLLKMRHLPSGHLVSVIALVYSLASQDAGAVLRNGELLYLTTVACSVQITLRLDDLADAAAQSPAEAHRLEICVLTMACMLRHISHLTEFCSNAAGLDGSGRLSAETFMALMEVCESCHNRIAAWIVETQPASSLTTELLLNLLSLWHGLLNQPPRDMLLIMDVILRHCEDHARDISAVFGLLFAAAGNASGHEACNVFCERDGLHNLQLVAKEDPMNAELAALIADLQAVPRVVFTEEPIDDSSSTFAPKE